MATIDEVVIIWRNERRGSQNLIGEGEDRTVVGLLEFLATSSLREI